MDEILEEFLKTNFTLEFRTEVYRSLSYFDKYEYNNGYTELTDVLLKEEELGSEGVRDKFIKVLNNGLEFILRQHTIIVDEETLTWEKNEIIQALYSLQSLEDYTPVMITLESLEDDLDKLTIIVSDLCSLDRARLYEIITDVNPSFLIQLKEHINNKETNKEVSTTEDIVPSIVNVLKAFKNIYGEGYVGVQLVITGILLGMDFKTYIPYIESYIVDNNPETTTKNLLSCLLMSEDGFKNTLEVYRTYSLDILKDLNLATKVESYLIKYLIELDEYLKVQNEKNRLSKNINIK